MKILSPELSKLIEAVRGCLVERPTDFSRLKSSLCDLLSYLTTPSGRTHENCRDVDLFFCLHGDNNWNWDHLPEEFRLVLDDIGGQLHDTVEHPEVAINFESTPEQLLDRVRKINVSNR